MRSRDALHALIREVLDAEDDIPCERDDYSDAWTVGFIAERLAPTFDTLLADAEQRGREES